MWPVDSVSNGIPFCRRLLSSALYSGVRQGRSPCSGNLSPFWGREGSAEGCSEGAPQVDGVRGRAAARNGAA